MLCTTGSRPGTAKPSELRGLAQEAQKPFGLHVAGSGPEHCWRLLFREPMLFCNYSGVVNADTVPDFKSNSHTLSYFQHFLFFFAVFNPVKR